MLESASAVPTGGVLEHLQWPLARMSLIAAPLCGDPGFRSQACGVWVSGLNEEATEGVASMRCWWSHCERLGDEPSRGNKAAALSTKSM